MSQELNEEIDVALEADALEVSMRRGKYFTSYSQQDLLNAIDEVKNGSLTAYAASKRYMIPENTLRYRMSGATSDVHGKSTVLSAEVEELLADWIKTN